MRLANAAVDRYGPLAGCEPPCDDDITIVAGPNESGKTLFLEGVLQLLDPAVTEYMEPGPRVEGAPVGRVVLDDGTDRHVLGDGTALGDVSPVEARHLHNLFVIRDSDLALPDGSSYYTSLVEHLGDVHTSELDTIREGLVEEGRLTASRLNLANRQYDTKAVGETARSLANEIDEYLAAATEQGVDELARTRRSLRRKLATVEGRLERQRAAAELATVADAAEHLESYRDATADLRAARVDGEALTRLRELDQGVDHARQRIDEIDAELERKEEVLARHRDALATARERHDELSQRDSDVSAVESELTNYRASAVGVDDATLTQRRHASVAGLIGAGIAGGASALAGVIGPRLASIVAGILGVALFLVAVGAWWTHRQLANRAIKADERERSLLQTARDAGFAIDAPGDVPVAVREYRDELDAAESRVHELDAKVTQTAERVAELDDERRKVTQRRDRLGNELSTTLAEAGVDSIDDYERRVEELDAQRQRRSQAETVLWRELGEPDATAPDAKADAWAATIDARRAAVDGDDVDAGAYDEAELARLEDRRTTLESRLDELNAELTDHRDALESFERRANALSPPPFVETTPSLQAHTVDGLAALADALRDVVDEIETNAEISRKAVGIIDEIRAAEERKAATLFDPDGPASETLERLTHGRYTAVAYDPDDASLAVHRADGAMLAPDQLSQGTRDQLYFAARLSLATQLLGSGAGFLLLDDPFLAADRSRLRSGFETLRNLAADGWQIVYLTAKREVHDTMAAEFDCTVYEMDRLEI